MSHTRQTCLPPSRVRSLAPLSLPLSLPPLSIEIYTDLSPHTPYDALRSQDYSKLTIGKFLGKGAFGAVMSGTHDEITPTGVKISTPIAIKEVTVRFASRANRGIFTCPGP